MCFHYVVIMCFLHQMFAGDTKRYNRAMRRKSSFRLAEESEWASGAYDDEDATTNTSNNRSGDSRRRMRGRFIAPTLQPAREPRTRIGLGLNGVTITAVLPDLAEAHGLRAGFTIASVDGIPATADNVISLLRGSDEPGSLACVRIVRTPTPSGMGFGFPFSMTSVVEEMPRPVTVYLVRRAREGISRAWSSSGEEEASVRVTSQQTFAGDSKRMVRRQTSLPLASKLTQAHMPSLPLAYPYSRWCFAGLSLLVFIYTLFTSLYMHFVFHERR